MKALTFLLQFIAIVFISTAVFSQRPNFVIIVLDDANEATLPPVGPSFLNYPSIQRIYQEGLQVCDAYCLQPLCNPSRYSMYTGMYPHVTGAIDNLTLPRADLPTFYSIAAGTGYHNAYVGKYSNVERKKLPGMEMMFTISVIDQEDPTMFYNNVKKIMTGNTTVIIDDTAEAWLATIDTPFIVGVGHIGTHAPISVVDEYKKDYNGKGTVPDNFFPYSHDFPSFLYADSNKIARDSNKVENDKEKIYEMLSEIDHSVGNIFSILESRGILDNTMLIFTNDNGYFYGEHQLFGKGQAREPSSAVPLFIRYPDWFAAGTTIRGNIIGLHDICPTVLEAAGINTQSYHFQGRSINYLLQLGNARTSLYLERIKTDADEDPGYIEPSWRAVRTPGFKYIRHHCESSVEEVFDLTADPEENSSMANNPLYADTLSTLRALLDSLAVATMDTISIDTVYFPCTLIGCQASAFYSDADGDGYGNPHAAVFECAAPAGYVSNGNDCNDDVLLSGAIIHPGAPEVCNSIDDNCNGIIDENVIIATISPPENVTLCKGSTHALSANSGSGISYQWMKNNADIPGATVQNFSASNEGEYKVREANNLGCVSTSAIITISTIANPATTIIADADLDLCYTDSVILYAKGKPGWDYQWQKGTSGIPGATNQYYIAWVKGAYKVIVTNDGGCSKTSPGTTVTKSCKGISIAISDTTAKLSLYPNPSDGKFIVELSTGDISESVASVEVFSEIGERVYQEMAPLHEGRLNQEIQLDNIATPGIYFVQVGINDQVFIGLISYGK